MAFAFPLARTEFLDLLAIRSMGFDLPGAVEMSKTAGGEVLTAALGTRLWTGKIALDALRPDEEADAMVLLDVLRAPGASFLVHDARRPWPRLDPGGAALGAATPTLAAVAPDTTAVTLAGLPVGYQFSRGDWLAFDYSTNPVRRALHRVAAGATAAGDGTAGPVGVVPNVRTGWAAGATVALIRAEAKAVVVPGSVEPGTRRAGLTTGAGFAWVQTLR